MLISGPFETGDDVQRRLKELVKEKEEAMQRYERGHGSGPLEGMNLGAVRTGRLASGKAKTDKVAGGKRYIPLSALEALGRIFLEGVPKYGEWNWKNGAGDKPYQMERWEHASRHLQLWAEGDRSEEHLAKVMWFCATQIELERMEQEKKELQEKAIDLDTIFDRVNRQQIADEEAVETLFSSTVRQVDDKEPAVTYAPRDVDAMAEAYKRKEPPMKWPGAVEKEGVVDTLKDVGLEVGTAALVTSIQKLLEMWGKRKKKEKEKESTVTLPDGVVEVRKEKKRVMSEEGKERIAAAQRKRWAKVRREKKAQERKG